MKFARWPVCALVVLGAGMFAPSAAARAAAFAPLPSPAPAPGWTYIWIAPAYRTVTERRWIPGSTQMVCEWMEISPGRWEQVWRQIVTPGHWEMTTRQVLISDGHWELVRVEPPPPFPPFVPPPVIVGNPGVADVTIQDPTTLVLTGKSYGQTNMIVLDAKGNPVADTIIEVVQSEANIVTVYTAGERSTIACAPSCNPMVMVGDTPGYTQQLTSSMGIVQSIAQ